MPMVALAVAAVVVAWSLQEFNSQAVLGVPAPVWLAAALLAWCLLGGRTAILVMVAGWTLCRAGWLFESRLPAAMMGRDVVIQGAICDFPRADSQALHFVVDADDEAGLGPWPPRIYLSWYDDAPALRPGERWQLRVRLRPPRGLSNDGGFDFEHWLYARAIAATGYVRTSKLNRRLPSGIAACPVGSARNALALRIERALGEHPGGPYVLGVAVGATQQLRAEDWELLRRTGTTHLLAISGLNIAMVAAPFLFAGPWLGRAWLRRAGRPHAGLMPALLAAAAYTALAGFAVSTVRALAMLCIAAAIALQRRPVDIRDLLASAALVVLAIDPAAVTAPGFWLSFLAVAWLVLAAGRTRDHGGSRPAVGDRVAGWWRRIAAESIGLGWAQVVLGLGLAPVTAALFGQVSVVAPFTNLFAVPVFSLAVMPLTLVGAALLPVAPVPGRALLVAAAEVVHGLIELLRRLAETGITVWEPPPPGPAALLMALAAALALCWWRPLPMRHLAAMLLLPALAGTVRERPPFQVTVMDVGQGLAVLVQTAHHALLYDAGPAFRLRDAGESVVVPVLRSAGVRHLDALVVSHEDQDHAGGAATVLRAFPRAQLIATRSGGRAAGEFRRCEAGLAWEWDGIRFAVLSPAAADQGLSDNDSSCVLRIDAAAAAVLLPGDIERRREDVLTASGRLRTADLVVAPHHGSRSSSSAAFVGATRPRFVVFSAGHRNRWGFPAAEIRDRWLHVGACALDTAVSGALVFATDASQALRLIRRERADGAHLWTADVPVPHPCPPGRAGLNSAGVDAL